MKHPKPIRAGDAIGVCAPSSGIPETFFPRMDRAASNVEALGYRVRETASVRGDAKCVSADAKTRAAEFMELYEDPDVAAIIPPWGGEFLMDMLPLLDFERISALPPKWVCGYSDLTTLTFPLTLRCDMATIHGSNFINLGAAGPEHIHPMDLQLFAAMSGEALIQKSSDSWGGFADLDDASGGIYRLDQKTELKALDGGDFHRFEGRMIGGCMDVLCKLIGTPFAPVEGFLKQYQRDGFVWTLESCEMSAADIYRTLWQMRQCGWFSHCNAVIFGRPDGCSDTRDFTLKDALEQGLGDLGVPVIYDADIGHLPPQMQIINGAYGRAGFKNGGMTLEQEERT